MKLTRTERWMLSNQYRILEKLYPDKAEQLANDREAIERGYECRYDEFTEHLDHDDHISSVDECEEVSNILEMFLQLKLARDKPKDMGSRLEFKGFDSWTEAKQMKYAKYCCETLGEFEALRLNGNFNSHTASLDRYRRMLTEWRKSDNLNELTVDDVARIVNA